MIKILYMTTMSQFPSSARADPDRGPIRRPELARKPWGPTTVDRARVGSLGHSCAFELVDCDARANALAPDCSA